MKNKHLAWTTLTLITCQIIVILVSWLISATMPRLSTRSLLSSEGIRWFFGQFTDNLASPLLIWIILGGMTIGLIWTSGLRKAITNPSTKGYRERFAMKVVLFMFLFFLIIIGLLTLTPQAILMSVTGALFPSSFSQSMIPIICFIGCTVSIVFGLITTSFISLTDIFTGMSHGLRTVTPYIVVYIFAIQLYYSVLFVLPSQTIP